jgi:hypothetical protein
VGPPPPAGRSPDWLTPGTELTLASFSALAAAARICATCSSRTQRATQPALKPMAQKMNIAHTARNRIVSGGFPAESPRMMVPAKARRPRDAPHNLTTATSPAPA